MQWITLWVKCVNAVCLAIWIAILEKDRFSPCAVKITPYNALPVDGETAEPNQGQPLKTLKIGVDGSGGKRKMRLLSR